MNAQEFASVRSQLPILNSWNGNRRRSVVPAPRDHFCGVRAKAKGLGRWLNDFPVCPALEQHHIVHVGVAKTCASPRFLLREQNSTCFLAGLNGQGHVHVDGRSYVCSAETACLLPSSTMDLSYDARKAWEFCWVCYVPPPEFRRVAAMRPPSIGQFDPRPLRCAIEGLIYESSRDAVPTDIQHWADLIHSYVMRFVAPGDDDERLARLWERVGAELGAEWNLTRLAHEAGYSHGHLGRLCRRQLGRSPMHHVTYLRMRRAAELLETTNFKIEAVAQLVGYSNPFVFSNAFTRCFGWRPSEYRRKQHKHAPSITLRP
jgi:AraC-like DNA-binding protein